MINPKKYFEIGFNLDEASSEETMEFLLFFSGFTILIVISPAIFLLSNSVQLLGASLFFGVADLFLSQYLPERMNFDESDKQDKEDNQHSDE